MQYLPPGIAALAREAVEREAEARSWRWARAVGPTSDHSALSWAYDTRGPSDNYPRTLDPVVLPELPSKPGRPRRDRARNKAQRAARRNGR